MSPFFPLLGIHLESLTVAPAHPLAFAFLRAATKVDLTPQESGSTLPSSSYPLPSRCPSCYVKPRLDLSRRCQQPLINVQEQPYCYVHRSSRWNAGDSSESRWLFLASLNEHQVEISRILRPFAMISREVSIWELPQMEYIFSRIIICKNYSNKMWQALINFQYI